MYPTDFLIVPLSRGNIDYNKASLDYAGTGTKTGVPQSSWDGRISHWHKLSSK
jgi:hypothetical protein